MSQEARELALSLDKNTMRPPIQNNTGATKGRDADKNFAAKFDFDPNDQADNLRMLKMTAPTDLGQKFLDKDDLLYIDRKAKEAELEKFDRWYGTLFDHTDPAQLQLSKQIYPEWFERRLKAIDETVEFQKRMARMQMLGIQSKEDVLTAYAVSSGRIDTSVYNYNVMAPNKDDKRTAKQYEYGFFHPFTAEMRTANVAQLTSATQPLKQDGSKSVSNLMGGKSAKWSDTIYDIAKAGKYTYKPPTP